MSVLDSNDIVRIDAIRNDMQKRGCDIQRNIVVDGRNMGFVTCFGRGHKYHVYTAGGCVSMQSSARGLYDYLQQFYPGWELHKLLMGKRSKLAPSHSTFIDQADRLQRFAATLDDVTKVSAGIITPAGVAPVYVRFIHQSGALLLRVRGNNAVQDVRVYSKDLVVVQQKLMDYCTKQGWPTK